MRMAAFKLFAVALALFGAVAVADPDLLQDVCAADLNSGIKLNGYPCKATFDASDFFSNVLAKPGLTNNTMGSVVTAASVMKVPGLNTQGISMSRIDYAPGGVNPPHIHPRASEIVFVLNGQIEVGFIANNVLVSKTIRQGEIFVFPRGLLHYQKNAGNTPASVLAAFNSQLPGTQSIGVSLFGSETNMGVDVLSRAFHIDGAVVKQIKQKFAPKTKVRGSGPRKH